MTDVPQTLVLTGVAGAGKSTVGRALAERVGAVLLDADDFPSEDGRRKMAGGVPLDDTDREPWIDRLAAEELARRLAARRGHFMPAELLASQLDTLEHLSDDQHAVVDGEAPVDVVVEAVLRVARG